MLKVGASLPQLSGHTAGVGYSAELIRVKPFAEARIGPATSASGYEPNRRRVVVLSLYNLEHINFLDVRDVPLP
jgi:hypothetical protein